MSSNTGSPRPRPQRLYANRRMPALLGLGFASGLPYVLAGDTMAAWLSDAGIDVKQIGLFSLIALPYTLKFLWSPLIDRYSIPLLGRRRGWLLVTQLALAATVIALAFAGPDSGGGGGVGAGSSSGGGGASSNLLAFAILGLALTFIAATQDIVADAYRTDVLEREEYGGGAAVFVTGYRIAMIAAGALALIIAGRLGFTAAYISMAGLMTIGIIATLFAPNPAHHANPPPSLVDAVVTPFAQFFHRWREAALLVAIFIVIFKMPDYLAARMTMPLLVQELQFDVEQVGLVRQFLGFAITIIGALVGGLIVARLGIVRCLIIFGILQAVSNLGFYALAPGSIAHDLIGESASGLTAMVAVISIESFCGGLVAAGFIAFLMSCCDRRYSATQYAVLSGLMALTATLGGAITGYLVESVGYANFFLLTIAAAVPGLALIPLLPRMPEDDADAPAEAEPFASDRSPEAITQH
jgi:PAT family beta-lactamase induction signal transducer AmpG